MRFSTTRRKFRSAALALLIAAAALVPRAASATLQTDPQALYRTMQATFAKGAANGWQFADQLTYLSAVLDAGRAYELVLRDDPNNIAMKGVALDLATRLNYNPLTNRDAAAWYVRAAAEAYVGDPTRGPEARALLAKLDAQEKSPAQLAHDADADATANTVTYPNDAEALIDQVDADLRAYRLTGDVTYRSLALGRAAQSVFPIGSLPSDLAHDFFPLVDAARNNAPGFSATDRQAAAVVASHKQNAKNIAIIGRVLSHDSYLVITAPADEYFGRTKLSPIGVSNELTRIGKYLDNGWGDRMTGDTLWVVDALDDWRHQYPRDYELPRLLLRTYTTLGRMAASDAKAAALRVRRVLTVEYANTPEARTLEVPLV